MYYIFKELMTLESIVYNVTALGFVKMNCYQILDLVISALAALGTIAATVTALYLAYWQDKPKLKVAVYKAVTVSGGKPWPESVAISITNRSKFPIQIDLMGWTFPKAPGCVCCAFLPEHLYSNGVKGSKIPFSIAPGEKSPLFSIPWNDFEETLHYMNSNDDGTVRREIQRKKVKFYVSTPRSDKNLLFDIDRKIMDAFVESLNQKESIIKD